MNTILPKIVPETDLEMVPKILPKILLIIVPKFGPKVIPKIVPKIVPNIVLKIVHIIVLKNCPQKVPMNTIISEYSSQAETGAEFFALIFAFFHP